LSLSDIGECSGEERMWQQASKFRFTIHSAAFSTSPPGVAAHHTCHFCQLSVPNPGNRIGNYAEACQKLAARYNCVKVKSMNSEG